MERVVSKRYTYRPVRNIGDRMVGTFLEMEVWEYDQHKFHDKTIRFAKPRKDGLYDIVLELELDYICPDTRKRDHIAINNVWRVGGLNMHKDYRGSGLAYLFYEYVINVLGYNLITGAQTPGSQRLWGKLSELKTVDVKAYHHEDYRECRAVVYDPDIKELQYVAFEDNDLYNDCYVLGATKA